MPDNPQSFQNHVRFDPTFHFFLAPLSAILLIGSLVNLYMNPGWTNVFFVLAAIWLFMAGLKIRNYALKVQDRVIRLEERLRLAGLLAEPLRSRVGDLTERQLIGLRFASDGEVVGLVEKTLASNWGGKEIKQAIQTWRPDHWRV